MPCGVKKNEKRGLRPGYVSGVKGYSLIGIVSGCLCRLRLIESAGKGFESLLYALEPDGLLSFRASTSTTLGSPVILSSFRIPSTRFLSAAVKYTMTLIVFAASLAFSYIGAWFLRFR